MNYLWAQKLQEKSFIYFDDLQVAWQTVRFAAQGNPIPFMMATYHCLGVHPDFVWGRITAARQFMLNREYDEWYDESGNLRKQFLDLPDWDPTYRPAPRLNSTVSQAEPATKWVKAPLRLVVGIEKMRCDSARQYSGRYYHREKLECGHFHDEFTGANPCKHRRRCRECLAAGMYITWASRRAPGSISATGQGLAERSHKMPDLAVGPLSSLRAGDLPSVDTSPQPAKGTIQRSIQSGRVA
jgi:hypothetical protein